MKPIGSVTTTMPREAASAIGTQHGGRGLATRENSRLLSWLVDRAPDKVDSALVSRASSRGVTLRVTMTGGRTSEGGFDIWARGCEADGPADAMQQMIEDVEATMMPAPIDMIERWLAELSVIVARRPDDEFGDELRVTAYASRLSRYPADVARKAALGVSWKFWPAWSEMERVCERSVAGRRHMIDALRRGPQAKEARKLPTAEERAALVRQLVRNKFSDAPKGWRERAVAEVLKSDVMRETP